ncbi:MAG TPA: HAD-IIB family hydrolase [Terriglobia bacterium]|nr:HAD-IIB family hydrolase [Terriglobia bacterium]
MPIRLLAVDLDGTLLNDRAEISPANREALTAAAAQGVEVVIVTGRRFHSARPLVASLACPLTLISSNGARIGNLEGEAYHRDFLPAAVALAVVREASSVRPHTVLIYDQPGCGQVVMQHGASLEGPLAWYRRTAPEALLQVEDLEAAARAGPEDPIQAMFGGPPGVIEPVEDLLRRGPTAALMQLTWTKYPARNTVILDVMNRHCTKGAALRLWAARRGVAAAEVMAIGDNHNDHEMLEFAGRPVVMANAEPGVGRDGWATTLSNVEHGVAAAVRRYVLEG